MDLFGKLLGWPTGVTVYRDPSKGVVAGNGILAAPSNAAMNTMWLESGESHSKTILKAREVLGEGKVITMYKYNTGRYITPGGEANGTATKDALQGAIDYALQPWYNPVHRGQRKRFAPERLSPLGMDLGGQAYTAQNGAPNPPITINDNEQANDTIHDYVTRFKNAADGEPLSEEEIEVKLWREGGSNFGNLIQRTNEALKETSTSTYSDGSTRTDEITYVILVRNTGHGGHLLSDVRMVYMPDTCSGADVKVITNLRYIVNAVVPDTDGHFTPHADLFNEESKSNDGENSDDRYAPFAVDLQEQKDGATAQQWAKPFLYKDPAGSTTSSGNQNRYGALYFTSLPLVSDADSAGTPAYLSCFSMALFGRRVTPADTPGAGDYKKTW